MVSEYIPHPEDWRHQSFAVTESVRMINEGARRFCVTSPTGGGKCLGRGTPVLMFDGTVKAVENIVAGDKLIGPDSYPRTVVATNQGYGKLFRVVPMKGMEYTVNEHHILALKFTGGTQSQYVEFRGSEFVEMSVDRYLTMSKTFKHYTKSYRVPVEFQRRDVILDPYYLGAWLGDGTSKSPEITKPDEEILECVEKIAADHDCNVVTRTSNGKHCPRHSIVRKNGSPSENPITAKLRELGVFKNKHVPQVYKNNSTGVRLEVLAGLLDTDGSYGHCFDFVSKSRTIADDVAFLCRSVGLAAYVSECKKECVNNGKWGTYWRVSISGDLSIIPTRIERKKAYPRQQIKDVLVTGITVKPIDDGEYFGFELDGDGLFLLSDFTVTHNSRIVQRLCEHGIENGLTTIVMSNRKVLTKQLLNGFDKAGIDVGCRAAEFEARSNPGAKIQIVSAQTEAARVLDVRRKYFRDVELHSGDQLIVDECHMNRGPQTCEIIDEYCDTHGAVAIGISATPLGVGKIYRDGLIVAGNNSELRECGALVWANRFEPWTMDLKKVYKEPTGFTQASGEKEARKIWTQHIVAGVYESWKKLNPDGRPSMGMAPGVGESLGLAQEYWKHGVNAAHVDSGGIFVNGEYKKTSDPEDREELFAMVKDGRVPQVWNRFVLREGVDIPELYCLQIATPIASLTSAVQVFGRVLRACKGKKIARIIDHCGVMDLHGSPNADRDDEWRRFFHNDDTDAITKERISRMTDPTNDEPQPITCPECGAKRDKGPKCLACGFEHSQSVRKVIQESGELRQVKGDTYKKRRVAMKPNTEQLWIQTYFRMKNAKTPKSFKQALALFKRENFYWPPDNLAYMPKNKADLSRKIPDVKPEDLHSRKTA